MDRIARHLYWKEKNLPLFVVFRRCWGHRQNFQQHGQSGAWVSDNLPHFATVADEVSFLKAVQTDQFNHGPAQLTNAYRFTTFGPTEYGFMGYLWFGK